MSVRVLLTVLLLGAAAPPLAAQRQAPPPGEARAARPGAVELLLRRRAELGLDARQTRRLREIGERMEQRNRPLVMRLLELRRRVRSEFPGRPRDLPPERRRAYRRHVEEARVLLESIRASNRTAMREVGEVLTPAQKGRVREMLREWRARQDSADVFDDATGRGLGF